VVVSQIRRPGSEAGEPPAAGIAWQGPSRELEVRGGVGGLSSEIWELAMGNLTELGIASNPHARGPAPPRPGWGIY
jgi:hypothetical protein